MKSAIIGCTGFVGATLLKQCAFTNLYRSTNIHEIDGSEFDTVVCAGAPAQKWIANRDPEGDRRNIEGLISHLAAIKTKNFILISTVDVFKDPMGVDEDTPVDVEGLHPYGSNRRMLEQFVQANFDNHLVVRLPGLVGPGLRKNVIFDFLNENNLHTIDSRGVFQFYPMVNLWWDIQTALHANLSLVHLASEPVRVSDIASLGFGRSFGNTLDSVPASYDFQTRFGSTYGAAGRYQYSAREVIQAVRAFAQSEPATIKASRGN